MASIVPVWFIVLVVLAVVGLTCAVIYLIKRLRFMEVKLDIMQHSHDVLSEFSLRHLRSHE